MISCLRRMLVGGTLAMTLASVAAVGRPAQLAPAALRPTAAPTMPAVRQVYGLDKGWLIHRMPNFHRWMSMPVLSGWLVRHMHCPWPKGLWKPVQLPNDYIVAGRFTHRANPGHGSLPVYPAWYRRTFTLPSTARNKTIWLNFGGVYRDAVVLVNGRPVGQHPSGYTAFRYSIGRFVHFTRPNTLTVFVDPRWFEGWWYEGGGIYRHVRLIVTGKLHVAPWGTFVISRVSGPIHYGSPTGDQAAAQLTIQTTVDNHHHTARRFTLVSVVSGPSGKRVARAATAESLPAGQSAVFAQHVALSVAHLWSLRHRNLYHLMTLLRVRHKTVDAKRTTFGIRTMRFDPNQGFFLNGRHVEIQGTCNHQDFPAVGIGAPDNLWFWRIKKLKALGANAYRTAHNPLARAFYRACDRLGMLVMDENRHMGDVYSPKTPPGAPYSKLADLKAMILQERNYPCIIMWSLGNEEVWIESSPYGRKVFQAMMKVVHQIDPTRPITCAYAQFPRTKSFFGHGFMKVENIVGCNYGTGLYARVHRDIPNKMIFGSEDSNSYSDRGVYRTNVPAGHINEYGTWIQHGKTVYVWGHRPWHTWRAVMGHPFVAGAFLWTGFDYRGEPNPIGWPDVSNRTGMMDLCGFPKPDYYYWHAWWTKQPSIYAFPAWDLPQSLDGKPILVRVYSNCQRVKLELNGRSLGAQRMPKYRYLDWQVPYRPGVLTAYGYDAGRVVATYVNRTAGPPARLRLTDEVATLPADGESLAPVAVAVVDAHGTVVARAANLVRFTVTGAGTLAGVANGNPANHESNVGHQVRVFHGLGMVLVRAGDRPGRITLTATARGLPPRVLVILTGTTPERIDALIKAGQCGAVLQKLVMARCAGLAPWNRPYQFNGIGDCYGYCRQVWNAILANGSPHAGDYYPHPYVKARWLNLPGGIPVNTYPDRHWVYFSDRDVLLPGDLLATSQGHFWGPDWHGGIYAGHDRIWDDSTHDGLNGAYNRPWYPGFHYYYQPIHQALQEPARRNRRDPSRRDAAVGTRPRVPAAGWSRR